MKRFHEGLSNEDIIQGIKAFEESKKKPKMMKPLNIALTIVALAIVVWIFIDPLWVDIWVFNKEIIMTNLAKWIPVAIMWSFADNIVDRLFINTKAEKWLKLKFTK